VLPGQVCLSLQQAVVEVYGAVISRENPKKRAKKYAPVLLCPPLVSQEVTRDRTRDCAARNQRLFITCGVVLIFYFYFFYIKIPVGTIRQYVFF
jgi:hypothetical protein